MGDRTFQLWDVVTGKKLTRVHPGSDRSEAAAFSHDGRRIAAVAGNIVEVWDAVSGDDLARKLEGHWLALLDAALSPDGSRAVTASEDRTLKLWNAHTGEELATLRGHRLPASRVVFTPDGTRIISSGGSKQGWVVNNPSPGELKVWDAETGVELLSLPGLQYPSYGVAVSPDGRDVVSAGGWDAPQSQAPTGEVKVWHADANNETAVLGGHLARVTQAFYTPNGKHIVTVANQSPHMIHLWNAKTGQAVAAFLGSASSITFTPDGARMAVSSNNSTVKVWDLESGNEVLSLSGHIASAITTTPGFTTSRYNNAIRSLSFSRDGKKLLSSDGKLTKVWDVASGRELFTVTHPTFCSIASFRPDGQRLVTAEDKRLVVRNTSTGEELLTFKTESKYTYDLDWSPDGTKVVTQQSGYKMDVWDLDAEKNSIRSIRTLAQSRKHSFDPYR
jgi:WD40 repeat protein